MRYTSTARKDGRWWVVQCDQVPGALSQVARLDQAVEHQREAIAMVAEVDEADVFVVVRILVKDMTIEAIDELLRARREAERAQRQAAEASRRVAADLVESGMTLRDAGVLLGVSHQRVAQLLAPPPGSGKSEVVYASAPQIGGGVHHELRIGDQVGLSDSIGGGGEVVIGNASGKPLEPIKARAKKKRASRAG